MKRWVWLVFVAFSLISLNAFAEIQDTVTRSFDVGQGGHLTLRTDRGSIVVEAAGGDRVLDRDGYRARRASREGEGFEGSEGGGQPACGAGPGRSPAGGRDRLHGVHSNNLDTSFRGGFRRSVRSPDRFR